MSFFCFKGCLQPHPQLQAAYQAGTQQSFSLLPKQAHNKAFCFSPSRHIINSKMLSSHFQFKDHAEDFYSYTTQERFYEVLKQHAQLEKVLLKHSSLQELRTQSKHYTNMLVLTLVTSSLAVFAFSRGVSFGPGLAAKLLKVATGVAILTAPVGIVGVRAKQGLGQTKKRAFVENRPCFRKYELTGDVLQTSNAFELLE